jgi:hypothetical protein
LRQILVGEAALSRWAERRQREHAVLQLVQRELPKTLAPHVGAVVAGTTELVLIATGGAAAALLRQRLPTLLAALEHGGWKFTVIRVRVQARSAPRDSAKTLPKQINTKAAAKLRAAAGELEDPALREALLRLANAGAAQASDDDDLVPEESEAQSPPARGRAADREDR